MKSTTQKTHIFIFLSYDNEISHWFQFWPPPPWILRDGFVGFRSKNTLWGNIYHRIEWHLVFKIGNIRSIFVLYQLKYNSVFMGNWVFNFICIQMVMSDTGYKKDDPLRLFLCTQNRIDAVWTSSLKGLLFFWNPKIFDPTPIWAQNTNFGPRKDKNEISLRNY